MMKTINLFTTLLAFVLATTFIGCKDFFNINTDFDSPSTIGPDQLLPTVVFYASQSNYDHAEYGTYFSQALTTGGRSQTSVYAYKAGWEMLSMNRHPQWRRHFYDIGVNVKGMIEEAQKINSKNFILIGRTIKLQSTLMTTDAFGDMPHSQVYKSNTPTYDSQDSIYRWMEEEVDSLILLYNDPAWVQNKDNKLIDANMDRMFKGDMGKWRAYTKSLKARMLVRKLPNWNNTTQTCDKIIAAVDDALNDPSYTDAIYKYDGGSAEKNCPWGPSQPKLNLGWPQARDNQLISAIPSKFFAYALLGAFKAPRSTWPSALDPRAEKMMTPRSGKKILFLENNIGMPISQKITEYPDLYAASGSNPYTSDDGYVMLMGKEELLFIKAEAQYWKAVIANRKTPNVTDAYNTTVEAVRYSMSRFGITDMEAPEVKRFFRIKLPGEATFTIADLMQQKYVAMYLQAEQWTDMRRYNYSSKTNGIQYNGHYVYTVHKIHDGNTKHINSSSFTKEFSLTRPFNLYSPYWIDKPENFGQNAELSPNAWIMRINYDPETEEKYNREELNRLGAYKNPDWLRKRMIWAYKNNDYVTAADAGIEWK